MRYAGFAVGHVLDPQELRLIGEELFGAWGWQTRLAEALEVDGSTVRRWVSGAVSVPGPVKVALRLMMEQKRGLRVAQTVATPQSKLPAKRRS